MAGVDISHDSSAVVVGTGTADADRRGHEAVDDNRVRVLLARSRDIAFADLGSNYRLTLRNGVLVYRKVAAGESTANATVKLATKVRLLASAGRAYYDKKIAEGKSPRYATRALKRHLASHLWRIMLTDENRTTRAPSEIAAEAS